MKAIFYKEIQLFFSNAVGYLIVASFLLINALLLWVFKGYGNVIYSGFANLDAFFKNSSWIFCFLIPAMTMKSFADEYSNGTLEILKTLPIKHSQIILGKFVAYMVIIIIALLPTLVFVYSTYQLGNPVGNLDVGSTFASYICLLLLASTYISIGVFSSIFTQNSMTAFMLSVLINLILYFGFSALENISETSTFGWNVFGITAHFNSMARGVISVSDVVYFISISVTFLVFTQKKLNHD